MAFCRFYLGNHMIREMQNGDVPAVMHIWLVSNCDAHPFIEKSYWESNLPFVTQSVARAEVYVAVENGRIIGFAGLGENGYIEGIFVEKSCRSKGVGKALLDFVKKKYDMLSLHVYCDNVRAVSFYQREEFRICAKQTDEPTNAAEYVMQWRK